VPEPASQEEAVDQALEAEETARLRSFSRIVMILVAVVAVQLPWLGGEVGAQVVAGLGLGCMFVIGAWGYAQASRNAITPQRVMQVQGWGLATCVLPVEYYGGFFSPMTVVLCLGIYHMAQSADRPRSGQVPLYVIFSWMVGAVLTCFGVLPDQGMTRIAGLSVQSKVFLVIGVTGTLLAALWLSRRARRSVRQALLDASRALLALQKRDAVLQEAQHQLDHAMRLVVGKAGRHTGAFAGEYELGEVIGLGAMGEVYDALHATSGRAAAIKLLHEDVLRREAHVARFLREAELCMRFDHPNVVKVYDVGRLPSGAPFMAMERLIGETLSDLLRERGHLPMGQVLELGDAVGAGLAHAHDKGVVHRDLKPHNVLAAREVGQGADPRWTILDFGISKPLDSTGTLTGADGVLGTPSYMSPEQARGHVLDSRSDLFSLASVLYRAVTGRPAFPGKDAPGIMFDVVYSMPEQPSKQVEGLAHDVDLAFAVALAKDPARRFRSALEMMAALRAAEHGRLGEPLRARGRELLGEAPWGTRLDFKRGRRDSSRENR
jgi:serine/threonine-protein kinase